MLTWIYTGLKKKQRGDYASSFQNTRTLTRHGFICRLKTKGLKNNPPNISRIPFTVQSRLIECSRVMEYRSFQSRVPWYPSENMLCHNGNKHTQASWCVGMTKHHMCDMKSSDPKISSDTDTHVVITPRLLYSVCQ